MITPIIGSGRTRRQTTIVEITIFLRRSLVLGPLAQSKKGNAIPIDRYERRAMPHPVR
jgi:hypothetical protein